MVVLMPAPASFHLRDQGWGYSQGLFLLRVIKALRQAHGELQTLGCV